MNRRIRKAQMRSSTTGTALNDRMRWYRNIRYWARGKWEDAYVSTNTGVEFYILAELDLSRTKKWILWYNWIVYDNEGRRLGKYKTLADAQLEAQRHFDRAVKVEPTKKVETGRGDDTPRLRIVKHR